ncbi:MAG: hypothetical protein Satyrvirus21_2 [Satyrvirus sp.]|uniref:C1q domain-containing protein n=1 Tax=Satyrvirus sp. TaxID=2487771 RepID=A0A3G5AEF7_9VIRU|nr:MAG: hypothetical protein Satyrvirus21_2 [Satyrvirus sp.]
MLYDNYFSWHGFPGAYLKPCFNNSCTNLCFSSSSDPNINNFNNSTSATFSNICIPSSSVTYITAAPTPTTVPTNGTPIPAGTGTVTTIIGFTSAPITNIGGITLNVSNGQFTIPATGSYFISGSFNYSANPTGVRQIYIYKIDATNNFIILLASDNRPATTVGQTTSAVATTAELNAGDRIFFATTQNSGAVLQTVGENSRFFISRTK